MTDNNAAKELQRKMQVLVRDLRAKGKDEKQIKLAKIALKRSLRGGKRGGYSGGRGGSTGGSFGNSSRGGFRDRDGGYGRNRSEEFPRDQSRGGGAQQQRGGRGGFVRPRNRGPSEAQQAAEHREELGKKHDVVLIPIMWKRNETQKEKVLQACNRLKQKLAEHRLNVWIDQRSKYTPGQKYAYWEHLGVQLRGEIGPAELASKTVVLSKCTEPGTVAKRWPNLTTKGNMKELLQQLKACGFQKINVPEKQDDSYGADEYESESESAPAADKPQFANGDTRAQHLKLPAFSGKKRTFEDVTEDDGETKDSNKKSASVDDYGGDSLEVNYVLEDTKPSKKDKKRN